MVIAKPLWNPTSSTTQEVDHPPPNEEALSRVTLVQQEDDLPPSYNDAECLHTRQRVSGINLQVNPIEECELQTFINTSNDNTGETSAFSERQPQLSQVISIPENGLQMDNNADCDNISDTVLKQTAINLPCASDSQIASLENCKRQAFVRNVYAIVSAQLTAVSLIILIFMQLPCPWVHRDSPLSYLVVVSFIIAGFSHRYCPMSKRTVGISGLVLYTLILGFSLAILASSSCGEDFQGGETILLSTAVAAITCISLTTLAVNLPTFGGILLVFLVVSSPFAYVYWRNVLPFANLVWACLEASMFSAYLVYDTLLIAAGKHRKNISWKELVLAVRAIHTDIMKFLVIVSMILWFVMALV